MREKSQPSLGPSRGLCGVLPPGWVRAGKGPGRRAEPRGWEDRSGNLDDEILEAPLDMSPFARRTTGPVALTRLRSLIGAGMERVVGV